MKVFVCTNHDQHYPVGCASVVVAADMGMARLLLDTELQQRGLKSFEEAPYTLEELDLQVEAAHVLNDGDY